MRRDGGLAADEIARTRLLFLAFTGGVVVFAAAALFVTAQGAIQGYPPLDPTIRSVIVLIVGAGCFGGLRICRSAYQPPRPSDGAGVVSHFRTRSVLGWAIVEGVGFLGICLGLLFTDQIQIFMLAALAVGALFLGRPDAARLDAALGRATD